MKNRMKYLGAALGVAWLLGGCSTTARMAGSGAAFDDLYATHDRQAYREAEIRQTEALKQLREQRALQDIEASGKDGYYSENILSDTYQESYERRLRGFSSLSYKLPGSYYDLMYSDKAFEASAYDPAFYNVILMGDQVWVEPRYITSMFGNWGTPVNLNLGWGWNRWYRPYWDWAWGSSSWYFGPSYAWGYPGYWGSSWGWGYDPYWGWGGYYGWGYPGYWGHNHWGGSYWGGGGHWGGSSNNYGSFSSTGRRGAGLTGATPGRYTTSGSIGTTSSTPRRGTSSSYERNGLPGAGGTGSGTIYRRGTSSGTSAGSGASFGTSTGYRRGTSTNSSGSYSGSRSNSSSGNSSTDYRRGSSSSSNSSPSYSSPSRNSGSYSSGSSSSGSSGSYSGGGSSSSGGGRSGSGGGGRR